MSDTKRIMSSFILKILLLVFTVITLILCILYSPIGILTATYDSEPQSFIIKKGDSLQKIAVNLTQKNLIAHPISAYIATIALGKRGKLQAGEFVFKGKNTPIDIINTLSSNAYAYRFITVTEGMSVKQIVQLLKDTKYLEGEIMTIPKEGLILPETYAYTFGENRQIVLNRMILEMEKLLKQVDIEIFNNPYITSHQDLLTLASLVEKETGVAGERAEIAGVYLNRLKVNMPLQCDPTVIYGITQGEKLQRQLTRIDLQQHTPYNTYTNKGLPPGPIACPGKNSILAVLSPARTQNLFFVANGTGGHSFSKDLKGHNQNVAAWRKIQK
ncbi:MAG: endolytic transglycosylase MltG [Alphaproteobacteria bacterium CG_4_10_14_0_8_um_filter_37_21]|nr:MAG: endolytic transglycosylase MltG [Alphaproteobacteria bacterium CG_4_10_14_0_8_um_filter_37_21]